jgi:uncharacterized cofD-like protein
VSEPTGLHPAGPAVAALGGGHGLSATLRAVRRYAGRITAVVSVADDGGSSGRLRDALGIIAPGDLRKCLVALGDPDGVWAGVLEHRFDAGELQGHSLGNLILAGLAEVTGDFGAALAEAGRLVRAVGRIVPATDGPVSLKAQLETGEVVGQAAVARTGSIRTVTVVPPDAPASAAAVRAVLEADQIVLGPGSLYTSVLAVTSVAGIGAALEQTAARKVYVCNLRPQVPETEGYDLGQHLEALMAHGVVPDVVVQDPRWLADSGSEPVLPGSPVVVEAPVGRDDGLAHDPARLAAVLADLVG